jgi:hypothetical protein
MPRIAVVTVHFRTPPVNEDDTSSSVCQLPVNKRVIRAVRRLCGSGCCLIAVYHCYRSGRLPTGVDVLPGRNGITSVSPPRQALACQQLAEREIFSQPLANAPRWEIVDILPTHSTERFALTDSSTAKAA